MTDQPDNGPPREDKPLTDEERRSLAREKTDVNASIGAPRDEPARAASPGAGGAKGGEAAVAEPKGAAPPTLPQHYYTGMPRGFWRRIDFILRNPHTLMNAIQRDTDLRAICGTFFLGAIVMAMIYGAVMGATNLLQGSEMAVHHKFFLIGIVAIKVPALFLLTLLIVLPPVYVSNAFVGARFTFGQILALLLGSTAITLTILASMASVALFFALTTSTYDFIKLLHVLFFAYAAIMGVNFLVVCLRMIPGPGPGGAKTPARLLFVWLLLYIFVGTQLAWVLRPFIASPNEPFQVFRPKSGNIYESVLHSINKATGAEKK